MQLILPSNLPLWARLLDLIRNRQNLTLPFTQALKSQIASECCLVKVLENGIACTNSCSILLGSLIGDLQLGFPDWDG